MERKSPLRLVDLPEDMLLAISVYLHVTDILSLKQVSCNRDRPTRLFDHLDTQTCRVLHAFGCSDYLWHLVVPFFDLPLDIGPDVSLSALSGTELQVLAVRAIKLEHNWTKPEPQIKKITRVIHSTDDMYVDAMTLLPGAKWLLTAQRGKTGSRITLWSLRDLEDVRSAATLHFPRCVDSYGTGMHQDGSATLTVTMSIGDQKSVPVCSAISTLTHLQSCKNLYTSLTGVYNERAYFSCNPSSDYDLFQTQVPRYHPRPFDV
jgi:hypothetical protein